MFEFGLIIKGIGAETMCPTMAPIFCEGCAVTKRIKSWRMRKCTPLVATVKRMGMMQRVAAI